MFLFPFLRRIPFLLVLFILSLTPSYSQHKPIAYSEDVVVEDAGLSAGEMQDLANQARQERRKQATAQSFDMPFYTLGSNIDIDLLVVSQVAYPTLVEVSARSPEGDVLPLATFSLEPQSHHMLPLEESLSAAGPDFREGSLRLDFLGDTESLQAWMVMSRGHQVSEVAFASAADTAQGKQLLYWDGAILDRTRPRIVLTNVGNTSLNYRVAINHEPDLLGKLEVGEQKSIRGPVSGSAIIDHDGQAGSLRALALMESPEGQRFVSAIAAKMHELNSEFEVVRIPSLVETGMQRAWLTVLNTALETRQITIDLIETVDGQVVAVETAEAPPVSVISLNLASILRSMSENQEFRLRIRGDGPGLDITAASIARTGEVLEWAIFSRHEAHSSGIYPLPSLDEFEVFTTLVNLGEKSAQIVGQMSWDGGDFAFGPFTIPAQGSHRLEPADFALRQASDLLGRRLDSKYKNGFLRWRVLAGSRELIARTEARPLDRVDTFGFNCNGCCEEFPTAHFVPSSVDFFVGQTQTFQSCLSLSTCTGTEGPWSISPLFPVVPSPFSWNGSAVSATAAAQEFLSFSFDGEIVSPPACLPNPRRVVGVGTASTCKTKKRKAHRPSESWDAGTTCAEQVGSETSGKCTKCNACCQAIFDYRVCKRVRIDIATSERNACFAKCLDDVCA